jgi:hypothetical protein
MQYCRVSGATTMAANLATSFRKMVINKIAMRQIYTLLTAAVVLGLSSCSSSKQTTSSSSPDMYSSPSKSTSGDYYAAAPNDQYIQMKATDPDRWSYFDDYDAYDSYYSAAPAYGGYGGYGGYYGGMGYPSGFGYGAGFGPSFGLGFGDPFFMWNSYFMWNSWYNPYFYNPYYGGGVLLVGKGATAGTSVYSNLRPFATTSTAHGLAHYATTSSGRNAVYRPGMVSTTAYNRAVARSASSGFRPVNGENNGFRTMQSTRSYSPAFNSGGGGGFRGGGGFGGRH